MHVPANRAAAFNWRFILDRRLEDISLSIAIIPTPIAFPSIIFIKW